MTSYFENDYYCFIFVDIFTANTPYRLSDIAGTA